ncbi:MAG TPA: type II secretion system F family protein, partial [Chondromyces sp.]|nr:type II secretion system F family protein [Chondromyces sp.]
GQQTESKGLKKILISVENDLQEGSPLSAALTRHERVFEPLFINMVRAGEVTGSLDETLEEMGEYYERQHRTRQKVITALIYPAVVSLIAMGVIIFLLVAVVPIFVTMFEDIGEELPVITQFVMGASQWIRLYWYLLVTFSLLLIGTVWGIRQKRETRYYLDYLLLRMPIIGNLLQKAALARMTRTLSSLFANSVPILQALDMVEKVVGNEIIAGVIRSSKGSLEQGGSMTEPMKEHWAIPPLIHHMISIGEETGSLDSMLFKVAEFYEREVEVITDRLKALIEPLMIVALAVIVGAIVISILVPMFKIFNAVQ